MLREVGDEQEQAAATLGASSWQTFWRVTLPTIRWGVAYGVVLTTARALGEIGAVLVVSSNVAGSTLTLPLLALPARRPGRQPGEHERVRARDRARGDFGCRAAADDDVRIQKEGCAMRIEVDEISKRFGDFTALDDVSLEVPEGGLTALLGPSGSGKSTLLRIIAGLEEPDQGVVQIAGQDVTSARPQDRGIGFVFQHYAAFAHMSVFENVAFGLKIRKRKPAEIRARVDELLELVGPHSMGRSAPPSALGRPAPADGARPGARRRAAGAAARRAVRRARRERPRRAPALAAPPPRRAGRDHRARDPRSGGGDGGRRHDRGDEQGQDRAGRRAARGLRQPGQHVRDGLPRPGLARSTAGSCARTTSRCRSQRVRVGSRRWSSASCTSGSRCGSSSS